MLHSGSAVKACRASHSRARKDRGEAVTDPSVAEKDRELDRALSAATTKVGMTPRGILLHR